MTPFNLPCDMKELAKRERYKQIEKERRDRIFNAKQRLIGIDYDGLSQQIEEKKNREKKEKEDELKILKKQAHDLHVISLLEKKDEEVKKKVEKEINEYRALNQKFEDRREFDLNDPNRLKKMTVGPDLDNPRLGLSSMQKFEGLDDVTGTRKRIQAEQQQTWLLQQMLEKQKERRENEIASNIYEETQRAQAQRYMAMKEMEKKCKRQVEIANQEYNRALAMKKMRENIENMRVEIEESQIHKINQITSDFLTENKDVATSNLGLGRKVTSMYKGMSDDQLQEIKKIQLEQMAEKEARKREEEMEEKYYELYREKLNTSLQLLNSLQEKQMQETINKLRLENKQLGEEQRTYREYMNKVVYKNQATSAFYEQFNTTTR